MYMFCLLICSALERRALTTAKVSRCAWDVRHQTTTTTSTMTTITTTMLNITTTTRRTLKQPRSTRNKPLRRSLIAATLAHTHSRLSQKGNKEFFRLGLLVYAHSEISVIFRSSEETDSLTSSVAISHMIYRSNKGPRACMSIRALRAVSPAAQWPTERDRNSSELTLYADEWRQRYYAFGALSICDYIRTMF